VWLRLPWIVCPAIGGDGSGGAWCRDVAAGRRGGRWRQSRFMDGRLSEVVAGEAVR
jgi:hypothetical protein